MHSPNYPQLEIIFAQLPMVHAKCFQMGLACLLLVHLYDTMYSCKIFIIVKNQLNLYEDGYQLYFKLKIYTDNLVIYQENISKCGHIQVLSTD